MTQPQLPTARALPVLDFERRIVEHLSAIECWFRQQWQHHTPPFYGSVDLRNAGFKLAPVDMNLFPGGFNNLSDTMLPCAVQAAQAAVERAYPYARDLLLIPERHTRNLFYLANVARIAHILRTAGLNVRIGTLATEITAPTLITLPDQKTLLLEPLMRTGNKIGLASSEQGGPAFEPQIVLLNNDLSAGIPEQLRNLSGQVLLPPVHAGWAIRRKSQHFAAYDEVAQSFARLIDIDPWLINPYFERCGSVDFRTRDGEACLAEHVDKLLTQLRAKYKALAIDRPPFVIVKADAGTYGMGIMTVRDVSDVQDLNRKQRNKMAVVKEGLTVNDVIIQEGVPTLETVNEGAAEPVVYMMDRFVVGGFYRVHTQRGHDENLNAPGMHFAPLPFSQPCNVPDCRADSLDDHAANRCYTYGVVARLALLAAAIEIERTAYPTTPNTDTSATANRCQP